MIKTHSLIVMIILIITSTLQADDKLQRSAFLGLAPTNPGPGGEVIVQNLFPSGTAQALAIQTGDKLISVNGQKITDFPSLIPVLRNIYEDSDISVEVIRAGETLTLAAKAQGRPKETGDGFSVEYSQFNWQENRIRTITYTPDQPRSDGAAVMYIQGYTCGSIDYGMVPDLTLNQLLATYAKAGFKVMKMEKPSVGDSEGQLDCMQIDFSTENMAFLAGLKHFKTHEGVNEDNVFIFGHSLGVLHAAFIAEKGLAKGVMGYGGVVKPWNDYMRDIFTKQAVKYFGTTKAQATENMKSIGPFLKDWLETDKPWSDVLKTEHAKAVQSANLIAMNGDLIMDRHYSFFRDTSRFDFRKLWAGSKSHVLMMHGTYDIQTVESGWQHEIAQIVNDQQRVSAKALTFERTEHALMQYPDLQSLLSAMENRSNNAGNPGEKYNPDIAKASLKWMQGILSDHSR
ncbi:PDZ domain-containing protein [Kordiimonas sp. SCSIO 12610]|uniref:PDZ domain-containing protein n=1 Tax=Kordiimonas sp. SCSIO 12610 TaxID=2829597 RepID=UPI00210CA4C2|nr:PDZ domain-containing protein [Kordiimonas sp. SCSIO 12610]UTW54663.1 PDZ domain-containing protein [Kordiimonas sp. SCSIO 12610]